MKRQTMANLAKDMDMWIEKRDQLSRKIDELKKQKDLILRSEVRTLCRMCYSLPIQHSVYFISVLKLRK